MAATSANLLVLQRAEMGKTHNQSPCMLSKIGKGEKKEEQEIEDALSYESCILFSFLLFTL